MGSGTMTRTLPVASRPKVGSPRDGVSNGDGAVSREAAEAQREAASMA
jgi:hypothetical protein